MENLLYEKDFKRNPCLKTKMEQLNIILRKVCKELYSKDMKLELSGGLDSRLILACILKEGIKPRIVTYYSDKPKDSDCIYSKQLCEKFGLEQEFVKKDWASMQPLEEPKMSGLFYGELMGGRLSPTDIPTNQLFLYHIFPSFMSSIGGRSFTHPYKFFTGNAKYPFFNKEVIEMILFIHPELLKNHKYHTEFMKKYYPEFMTVAWTTEHTDIPCNIKSNTMDTQVAKAIIGKERRYKELKNLIKSSILIKEGYFTEKEIRSMLRKSYFKRIIRGLFLLTYRLNLNHIYSLMFRRKEEKGLDMLERFYMFEKWYKENCV